MIAANLENIRKQIHNAEKNCHRPPHCVKLVAVSKNQSIKAIKTAVAAEQYCFGENYIQEALPKIRELHSFNLEWHFIGTIQSNKTKAIAENFNWVHSVCRASIAKRLNAQRPPHLPPLNVCIEVNVSHDPHKSGIGLSEIVALAHMIQQLPRLKLRGLMTITAASDDSVQQAQYFQNLSQEYAMLQRQGFLLDTLSMGMSNDFVLAINAGSTLVRIGTAIFGPRH